MANVKDRTFRCDFCGKIADFDAKTKFGPWAYLCAEHFQQYGIGLGIGKGQKLHPHPIIRLDADFHEEDLHNT